ncbi:MAG: putative FAD-linked oxidoreductase [Hyphomicrobiales bacterium]|nr:putative FAD-linked oxidoreductase [Hyphomicrobiales bacterium]
MQSLCEIEMSHLTEDALDLFRREIPGIDASIELSERQAKSKDFHWYSPILTPQLQDCLADIVVKPRTEEEVRAIIKAAFKHKISITLRGGGTGNYGQSVPLQGGIILDMTGHNQIVAVKDGELRVQAGAYIKSALDAALATGQQLMMYPSTMRAATIGGYLGGGFAGIGSVKHGIIRDSGMIVALKIMTIEEEPRIIELVGKDVGFVFHSWGTTGVILEASLKLVKAQTWIDCIATFPTYGNTIAFGNAAFESDLDIFLLSAVEKRFAPFYKRTQKYFDGSRDAIFSMVNIKDVDAFFELAARFDGQRSMAVSEQESKEAQLRPIHTTAFNHTTLMALQADPNWTYLQVVMPAPYTPELAEAQLARFGDEVLMHHEYTREHGHVRLGGLPLIKFTTEERLSEIMRIFEADGCTINNPHIFKLEDGGRFDPEGVKMAFRRQVDPLGLLNPGNLRSLSAA